jgi:hypothetical protein
MPRESLASTVYREGKLTVVFNVVAIDMGMHTREAIAYQRSGQADKLWAGALLTRLLHNTLQSTTLRYGQTEPGALGFAADVGPA